MQKKKTKHWPIKKWKIICVILFVTILNLFLYKYLFPRKFNKIPSLSFNTTRPTKGYMVDCQLDNWNGFVLQEYYFIFVTLINQYNWECMSKENLKKHLKFDENSIFKSIDCDKIPDLIMFWGETASFTTSDFQMIKLLRECDPKIKIVYYCDDLHGPCDNQIDLTHIFRTIDTFMSPYTYRFKHFYQRVLKNLQPEEYPELLWIPHSAIPPFTDNETIPFNSQPEEKLFLSGMTDKRYPYRFWLKNNSHLVKNLVIYPHPGYGFKIPKNHSEVYASNINKYLASFTCGNQYLYLVAKVFELPATGSLLMLNNHFDELMKALGLFPQVHYYNYSALDPLPDIQWVFRQENRAKVDEMRRNGMNEIRKHHRTSSRAQAIYEYFHSGTVTYKLPKTFIFNGQCPNVLEKENCKPLIM